MMHINSHTHQHILRTLFFLTFSRGSHFSRRLPFLVPWCMTFSSGSHFSRRLPFLVPWCKCKYSLRPILLFVNTDVSTTEIYLDTSTLVKSIMGRRE
jgi:hypothetical protein